MGGQTAFNERIQGERMDEVSERSDNNVGPAGSDQGEPWQDIDVASVTVRSCFTSGGRHMNPSLILSALTDDSESLSEGHRDWMRFRISKFVSVESREERVSM
jgi:hypothetical protein